MLHNTASPYAVLNGHFSGAVNFHLVSEQDPVIPSVPDNMQRTLTGCVGTLAHRPIGILTAVLLKQGARVKEPTSGQAAPPCYSACISG